MQFFDFYEKSHKAEVKTNSGARLCSELHVHEMGLSRHLAVFCWKSLHLSLTSSPIIMWFYQLGDNVNWPPYRGSRALKYPWEISDTCLAFLDIKLSIEGNSLCTGVHYKPTHSHSYLLYSSSHPSHVKNSIPYSQLLRLRRLCSEDSDFSLKSEEMCHFLNKHG